MSMHGELGQPEMTLVPTLGDEAAGPGGRSRASFVARALRNVVMGSVGDTHCTCCASLGVLARVRRQHVGSGMTARTDEHVV
jgi:hypothetical protein